MILIFDYFETLLSSKSIDFNRGLKVFWEKNYKDKCQFEDIKTYGEELFNYLLSMHGEGGAHIHWHLFPRRDGDIENYGNNGRGPVWWYPREEMYSDKNRPSNEELENLKTTLQIELDKLLK